MPNQKIILFLLLAALTTFGLCPHAPAATADSEEPSRSTVCLGMCDAIQKLCAEDIAEGNVAGRDLHNGILDETSCLLMCEAEWDDTTLNCVNGADTCAQFLDEAPYCLETEEQDEPAEPASTGAGCAAACKNYVKCVAYGDGISLQDQVDAYNTCMQVCPTWTPQTQKCIASTPIRSAADCMAQTACIIGSLQNMMPPKPAKK